MITVTRLSTVLLSLLIVAAVLENCRAQSGVVDGGPQNRSQTSSIGALLSKSAGRPLHILYVHGIGATGAGDSLEFQKGVCAWVKGCTVPATAVSRDYADSGEFAGGAAPPRLEYMGTGVWTTTQDWSASAPFVDHYVLRRGDGAAGAVVVDEINWWPLVFPLKCRAMMTGEAQLAGPDKTLLDLCSQNTVTDAPYHADRYKSYAWISSQDAEKLILIRSKGALVNRDLKNLLLDWGFSDAIMAVGSMHGLFREGMRQLFVKSARFNANNTPTDAWEQQQLMNPHGIDREFVVVSHSLGSYLVFSTLNMGQPGSLSQSAAANAKEDAAAEYILERTSLVYFFANQVPLLELASMGGPKPAGLAQAPGALSAQLKKWKTLRQAKPAQVIAWSDPSDLLSWYVPAIEGLVIDNLYVRNTWWHWLFANPSSAHDNYDKNKTVLRIMLGP
jgi:hypothetical protein